jgi:hypothetical protein
VEILFLVREGGLVLEFMQQGTTVTSKVYYETLKKLSRVIQEKKKAWNADPRCNASP